MKQKLVVFDFDYTLFDAELWKDLAYTALAELFDQEVTEFKKIAKSAYDETRKVGYFDPSLFAKELVTRFDMQVTVEDVLHVLSEPSLFQKSYYVGTLDVLKSLASRVKFAMFSTNESNFQKLKSNEIIHFFEKDLVFISPNKEEIIHKITELTETYEVFFVDDLLHILRKVKEVQPAIYTIWIKQGIYATGQDDLPTFKPDKMIYNLKELPEIILSL
jgi:FMN phosphatase YigB (HAD superfamily)